MFYHTLVPSSLTFWAYIDTKQIICDVYRVNVKNKNIDFGKSTILRYKSSKKEFKTLKNGTIERNTKEFQVYRLYPRDEYDIEVNVILVETLNKYTSHLKSQNSSIAYNLKLNNEGQSNQSFAEFVTNDTINKGVE